MAKTKKYRLSIKAIFYKLLIVFCVLVLLLIYSTEENDNQLFELNEVAFLYEGDQLVGINSSKQADELQTQWQKKSNELTSEAGGEKNIALSTKVVMSPSLVNFDIDKEDQSNNIKYVNENTKLIEQGYTLTIDDTYKYYIQNIDELKWLAERILLAYLPDESYLNYLMSTGKFKEYTKGKRTYTGISLENKVTVSEGFEMGSEYIDNKEDLLFKIFHLNQNPQEEYVSSSKTINQIKTENEMTNLQFKINNPTIADNSVTYNQQPVIVNELEPIVRVVQTFETTKQQTIEYETVQEETDDLLEGQVEVKTEGKTGIKELTYENTEINGEVTNKRLIDEKVIEKPVHEILLVGASPVVNSVTVDGSESGSSSSSIDGDMESSTETSTGLIWPSSSTSVTCEFGCYSGHTGIDIQSYYGGPIYAAASGTVVTSGWSNYGYGYHVVIDHGNGLKTLYAHQNQQPPVSVGQTVSQGQVIGFEGETGMASGVHLHFEVQINGTAVNPRGYI